MEILKVCLLFGGFGIGAIFLRYLPQLVEQKHFRNLKDLFFKGTLLSVFLQLIVLVIFLGLKGQLASLFKTPLISESGNLLALLIFLLSLIAIFQNCLTGLLFQRAANYLAQRLAF